MPPMSETQTTQQANGRDQAPAPRARVRFRDGQGGDLPHEWAAWMLTEWRDAEVGNAKAPKFSDVLQRAALHFMMEARP